MKKRIEKYFDRLFPLNRSLTGQDYQKSLDIISEIIPLKKINFLSGTKVFDWIVPKEWNVKKAYIADLNKKKLIDFEKNNLHLMGYSKKVSKKISLNNLKKNLYFIKKIPNAIPYVTSYYKERWGFSLSYNQFKRLKDKFYNVEIDSSLKNGKLTVGEKILKGKSKKEILISSYLCHPSMANNELSGPLTLAFLFNHLKKKKLKFSIRFLIAPESIGTISYLSRFKDQIKKNVIGGYNLSCCGIKNYPHYKMSKKGSSIIDVAILHSLKKKKHKLLDFSPIGSDECRYETLGINIPFGAFLRTDFDNYRQYHTSLDNKKIFDFNKIFENIKILDKAIDYINKSNIYLSKIKNCEPFLSKYKVYPTISKFNPVNKIDSKTLSIFWLMSYSDGKTTDLEISELSKINIKHINKAAMLLVKKGLLTKIA